jgi:hypothetical protein
MSYRRPNYDNDNRGQNTRNYGSNTNNSVRCYTCGQMGHISRTCAMRLGDQRNSIIPPTQEPARIIQPQTNTVANQSVNQIPLKETNGRTFITQQEEAEQPSTTAWEGVQHLNC